MLSPEQYGLQQYKSFGCDFGGSKLAQWRDIEGAVLQHWTCLIKGSLLVRNT